MTARSRIAREIAEGGSGTSTSRAAFWPLQLGIMGPAAAAAWIPGLVRLFRDPEVRRFRAFAVAYVVLGVWFTLTGAKAYYLAGLYPVLVAAGSVATVRWMWARKSASVRVGPQEGATTWPVTTSRLTMKVRVPWRTYSNSRRSTLPGSGGKPGCVRSSAWTPVSSSVLMIRSPRAASSGAAR